MNPSTLGAATAQPGTDLGAVPRTELIDVGKLLDLGPFTGAQRLIVALAALSILMDGFDGQLIGYAIPSILKACLSG